MNLGCDVAAAIGYKSQQQIARILSEMWFRENGYCLACENNKLLPTAANTKASDFRCGECDQNYELKAFRAKPTHRLVDGAYGAMITRIQSGSVPTLMLLERTEDWQIRGLTAIHHLFLTPRVIEKRKPLSATARRAGWVGCSIRLDAIGPDAQISLVDNGIVIDRDGCSENVSESSRRLKSVPLEQRGWTTFVLGVIRNLQRTEFSLQDIYSKEQLFAAEYPKNHNIRPKIRQQLQVLRDLSYLEFHERGQYRLLI